MKIKKNCYEGITIKLNWDEVKRLDAMSRLAIKRLDDEVVSDTKVNLFINKICTACYLHANEFLTDKLLDLDESFYGGKANEN